MKHLFIIGGMKCGTSSLFEYIAPHPEICPSCIKEPEFFSEAQTHSSGFERFEELWPDLDEKVHTYAMEASTGYTKFPTEKGVPRRIRENCPEPKFIYLVRDPVERIESHLNYVNLPFPREKDPIPDHIIWTSRYQAQLEQYYAVFPREDILVLDFEDLKTDTDGLLNRVCRFLDLPPLPARESYAVVNALTLESGVERKLLDMNIQRISKYFPRALRDGAKALARKLNPPRRRHLTEKQAASIRLQLRDDMLAFGREHSINVERWGFAEQ